MINASFGAPWQRAAPLSVRAVPLRWQRLVLADARSAGLWGSGRPGTALRQWLVRCTGA